uniref:Uncharacterized protein n=1 Tax=Lepeophtheirus salmonis TaxID=72036 RepID=A0A0K2VFH0_LEPSM
MVSPMPAPFSSKYQQPQGRSQPALGSHVCRQHLQWV